MAIETKLASVSALVGITLTLSGCSGEHSDTSPPRSPGTSSQAADDVEAETRQGEGVLTVRFSYAEDTALYAEGARHYVRLLDRAGEVVRVKDTGTDQGPGAGYTTRLSVAPGRYQLETFQRGCDLAKSRDCEDVVGPRQGICEMDVSVRPERVTRVWVMFAAPSECGPLAKPLA